MKAVLSGETAIFVVPSGQPEPFAFTTRIVIRWSGVGSGRGPAWAGAAIATAASAAAPAVRRRNMR
ncbi:hypothetical protein L3i22_078270 [Actinoplanes sp. L3-i22]|nr:hypothetical protein L3i22_078270 [Actinoplanes sp. L3-i22]